MAIAWNITIVKTSMRFQRRREVRHECQISGKASNFLGLAASGAWSTTRTEGLSLWEQRALLLNLETQ